jgi:hypothetical protein
MWLPAQPGRWRLAPFWPQLVQRAPVRGLSLEASGPHRMTATAQGSGADADDPDAGRLVARFSEAAARAAVVSGVACSMDSLTPRKYQHLR